MVLCRTKCQARVRKHRLYAGDPVGCYQGSSQLWLLVRDRAGRFSVTLSDTISPAPTICDWRVNSGSRQCRQWDSGSKGRLWPPKDDDAAPKVPAARWPDGPCVSASGLAQNRSAMPKATQGREGLEAVRVLSAGDSSFYGRHSRWCCRPWKQRERPAVRTPWSFATLESPRLRRVSKSLIGSHKEIVPGAH